MKRLPHVAMLLVAVVLVAADEGEKKKQGDAEKIQGKWIIVESWRKGKKVDEEVGGVMTFSGKNMTLVPATKARKIEIVFEMRPDKKPRELDMTFSRDGEEFTLKAIYELSGDTLKICALEPGKPRPDAVGIAVDDERQMLVLKRVKNDKRDDEKRDDDKGNDKE